MTLHVERADQHAQSGCSLKSVVMARETLICSALCARHRAGQGGTLMALAMVTQQQTLQFAKGVRKLAQQAST
jgi:hypothetical protein